MLLVHTIYADVSYSQQMSLSFQMSY